MNILQSVKKLNTRLVNTLLICCVITLLGGNYLLYSFFDLGGIRNLVRLAAAGAMMVLLLFRLMEGKIRQRQMIMLLLAACQILCGGTNGMNIAFLLILTVAVANYRECDTIQAIFWIMLALTAVVALSLLLGIEENEVYKVYSRTRYKLGFENVNAASMFLFTTLVSYLLYRGQKAGWKDLILVLVAELVIFKFTDSRTPLLCLMMLMGLYVLIPRLSAKAVNICCCCGIALLFLSSYLWPLPVINSELVNKLLSLRPQYCDEYFRNQSALTFLVGGSVAKEIDNGFLLLMFNAGVIVYTMIYFVMQKAVKQMYEQGAYMKMSFVLSMLACSVLEGSLVRPELLCAPLVWILVFEAMPGEGKKSILLAEAETRLAHILFRNV